MITRLIPLPGGKARYPALLAVGLLLTLAAPRRGAAVSVNLQLQITPAATNLIIPPITNAGALFVFTAPTLTALVTNPTVFFQTNAALPDGLQLPLPPGVADGTTVFFTAARWPGTAPSLASLTPGTFEMGSPNDELGRFTWEGPQTTVTLTRGFLMGRFEVTQQEYKALFTNNPSYFSGVSNRPVEQVSWEDAMEYCRRLTTVQRNAGCLPPGWAYRLPTVAEWEYACRAGTETPFHYGTALHSGMANFDGKYEWDAALGEIYNTNGVTYWRTTSVGGYAPNAWGLYDMHGNVWEWCLDWWSDALPGGNVTDPRGPQTGTQRTYRGGCWYNDGRFCRAAYRLRGTPTLRGNDIGFRVVLAPF